jgi:hypothetical protein
VYLGLGAVALLVGAIGVANIMVISVLERRPEIGLRRALGVTRGQIRAQFLAEAILLSLAGGAAGVILGTAAIAAYARGHRELLVIADRPLRKVIWEAAATRPVPALPRPVPVPATAGLRSSRASRPECRAARGPSTGSGAPALYLQHQESLLRATKRRGELHRPSAGKPCPSAWEVLCALSRRRHVYAAEMCAYQALPADDFR